MKVRKGNRVLEINEVELPNFLARGYVVHESKPVAQPQPTGAKQPQKPQTK